MNILRTVILAIVILAVGCQALCLLPDRAAIARNAARPNILLIFADDLGWKVVGYQLMTRANDEVRV